MAGRTTTTVTFTPGQSWQIGDSWIELYRDGKGRERIRVRHPRKVKVRKRRKR